MAKQCSRYSETDWGHKFQRRYFRLSESINNTWHTSYRCRKYSGQCNHALRYINPSTFLFWKIISPELQLGTLLNQEKTLGSTTFDIELQGFKYHDGKAESYIKGVISSFTYKQYEYRNIMLDGQYTPGGFNGKLSLNDSNANIEINGHVATRQAVPDFNLKAVVRNFRPNDLNLTDQYKDTDMSLNLTADFSGHSIDDMKGKSVLTAYRSTLQKKINVIS